MTTRRNPYYHHTLDDVREVEPEFYGIEPPSECLYCHINPPDWSRMIWESAVYCRCNNCEAIYEPSGPQNPQEVEAFRREGLQPQLGVERGSAGVVNNNNYYGDNSRVCNIYNNGNGNITINMSCDTSNWNES